MRVATAQASETEVVFELAGDVLINKSDILQDLNVLKGIAHMHVAADWIAGATSIPQRPC